LFHKQFKNISSKHFIGGIVPAAITIGLIAKAMRNSGKRNFLIDGFPRNWDNMLQWNSLMEGTYATAILLKLHFDIVNVCLFLSLALTVQK
jgi:UMP-CMP kinase